MASTPNPIPHTEQQLEADFLTRLAGLKYTLRPTGPDAIRDRAALKANFRQKFQELNKVNLTDAEFEKLLAEILTADVFTAAHTLRNRNSFTRDDGAPCEARRWPTNPPLITPTPTSFAVRSVPAGTSTSFSACSSLNTFEDRRAPLKAEHLADGTLDGRHGALLKNRRLFRGTTRPSWPCLRGERIPLASSSAGQCYADRAADPLPTITPVMTGRQLSMESVE